MSPELSAVLDEAVKMINFIQSWPMNHSLLQNLCHDSGSELEQLLLYTVVRRLSGGQNAAETV